MTVADQYTQAPSEGPHHIRQPEEGYQDITAPSPMALLPLCLVVVLEAMVPAGQPQTLPGPC